MSDSATTRTVLVAGRLPVEMTRECYAAYVAQMRRYYESLPAKDQPQNWPDIREELLERDAIQHEAEVARKNIRIFSKLVR